MKKSDERKILIGRLARQRTLVGNEWIAGRLCAGDPSRVSRYGGWRTEEAAPAFARELRALEKYATCKI